MHNKNDICKNGRSLSLSTKGNLRVVFLGVGSAFTKRNRQSNFLIIQGDHHVLVDCGTLGPLALDDVGLSVNKVKCYLPTHSHADHIGGFEEVALVNRYISNSSNKPKMIVPKEYQDLLWDKSLAGELNFVRQNRVSHSNWKIFLIFFVQKKWSYLEDNYGLTSTAQWN
jgi:ribonuclease BN (tRNA processing enzyme)